MRFKERSRFQTIKVQGEAASANVEAAVSYPVDPPEMVNKGGCTKQQIVDVDACWRTKGTENAHLTEKASWDWKIRQEAP